MEFQLDWVACCVAAVPLAPIVADGIREDVAVFAEGRGRDAATDFGIAFETVLGVLVPEVEGAVGAGGAEGAVLWVEGNCVYGIDLGHVTSGWICLTVAFEGEIEAIRHVSVRS